MKNHAAKITNWKEALNNAKADSAVGIKIAVLVEDDTFGMYVTEIIPKRKVGAHYHREGLEVYSILSGNGMLHTAFPNDQDDPIDIISKSVVAGDFFNINPGVIHQLENTADESLILVFGCPASHLSSDRVLTKDLV